MRSRDRNVVLLIETASHQSVCAIFCGTKLIAKRTTKSDSSLSENLVKNIKNTLIDAGLTFEQIVAIGVGVGPGNFTSLRIGASVAKGLAMALKIKAFGVSRFETLVDFKKPTLVIVNAKEDKFYSQMFRDKIPAGPPKEVFLNDILRKVYPPDTIVTGDNARKISQTLDMKLGKNNSRPKMRNMAFLVTEYMKHNGPRPVPVYVRGPNAKLPKDARPKVLEG